ncbi:MAG: amino acid ABC transporter permease, partial [Alphaproteobacteria bacterium]|nr:amino acid ABC transporter permease [Alphaproteobacteria bacterium]
MDRFLDTFFNLEIMGRYLPKILSGMVVTTYLGIG